MAQSESCTLCSVPLKNPMRRILYTMHFVSRASHSSDSSQVLRTSGSATSCVVTTVVSPAGVQTDLRASQGDLAFFESELRLTGVDEFEENGEITFGDESAHVLKFSTQGPGHIALHIEPGVVAGSASWRVDGGRGQFASAQGFISSTFTITDSGERSDFQCGLIFVPE